MEARPLDWIFPNDHINYASDVVIEGWKESTKNMDFDRRLCLRTLANMNPKCYGCKACSTPEDIKFMTKRDLESKTTYAGC